MSKTINFASREWPTTGRGIAAADSRPLDYVGLSEEVPGIEEYRWYLYRTGQAPVEFSDLDNAHAFITGHGIVLDFIEPFQF
jgi:hypothetical protein